MGWALKARGSLFPDWPWLFDESSQHRRALHILVQILAGKFKIEFLQTVKSLKSIPCSTDLSKQLRSFAPGKDFMQVWMNLCYRKCLCKTMLPETPLCICLAIFEQ